MRTHACMCVYTILHAIGMDFLNFFDNDLFRYYCKRAIDEQFIHKYSFICVYELVIIHSKTIFFEQSTPIH